MGREQRSGTAPSVLGMAGTAAAVAVAVGAAAYALKRVRSKRGGDGSGSASRSVPGGARGPQQHVQQQQQPRQQEQAPAGPAPAVPRTGNPTPAFEQLHELFQKRIAFIDGAMGTSIQEYKLEEEDFRGERYKDHGHELRGNNDILVLTRPDVIEKIHMEYLESGADIIETNTFNGTTISQADYELDALDEVADINREAARLAKKCTAKYMEEHPGEVKFVAGAIGPTNKTLSVSPSVENPEFRGITYDEVHKAYYHQARAHAIQYCCC